MANKLRNLFAFVAKCICCCIVLLLMLCFFVSSCESKYSGPPYIVVLYQYIDSFAERYCKKNNMELLHIGDFTDPHKHVMYGIWLRSFASETLEQGRFHAAFLVKDFWEILKNNELARICYDEEKRYYPVELRDKMTTGLVGVKIAYWDKNVNRPLPPYLAEITFYGNKFYYYQADPVTQALVLVFEESYDQAIADLSKEDRVSLKASQR